VRSAAIGEGNVGTGPLCDPRGLCALSKKIREGNIVAIIWYTKNRWGWRDVVEQQRNGVDVTVQVNANELARELEKRSLPTSIFGIDKPAIELPAAPKIEHGAAAGPALAEADPDAESDDARRESRMQGHVRRNWRN
jgi:hypothetical protein